MKKISFLLFIATALSGNFPVQAYTTCKGGVFTLNKKFCKSTGKMNWYSAVNWCKANGGELAKQNNPGFVADETVWCSTGSCIFYYSNTFNSSTPKINEYPALCE